MKLDAFFDNFELMADAPNGVQMLRQMILQLAVQGKLVPQYPKDEPASVLLENIKTEKERLVKEKKIKRPKPLPPINLDEMLNKLPVGWEWVRLDNISINIHYGYTASANNSIKDVRLLRITDIQNGLVDWENVPGCEIDKSKVDYYVLNSGDLLIARTGGTIGKTFLVEDTSVCAVFASYLIRVIPSRQIYPQYLKYFAISPLYWEQLYAKSSGTGQPNVNATSLKALVTPLPPFKEQKRIVSKVDELMALCDKLEARKQQVSINCIKLNDASIHKLLTAREPTKFSKHWQRICDNFNLLYCKPENVNKLRQAILQLAVQGKLVPQDPKDEPASVLLEQIKAEKERLIKEKKIKHTKPLPPIKSDEIPYELPDGWEWVRLGGIGFTQTGTTPSKSKPAYFGKYIPFIKPADILENSVNYENEGLSKQGLNQGRMIENNSVLMVCIGGSIGKVNFIERPCSCNQQINTITPYAGILYTLLNYFMRSPYFQNEVVSRAPKTTLPIISKGKWELIPTALPTANEQKRIVAKVDELMALCDELETSLSQSQMYCDKLMEAAVAEILAA